MLFKLSMSGLKSKSKDYIVLLIGLVMSISIFYMFQTLALNKSFIQSNSVINSIGYVFQTGSVLLASITFFYILYANSFLLSLRQKEFGMYMTLGAKKSKIAMLMFIETIVIGIVSLVIGITLGIGLAQVIGKLLMKQLDFTANGYEVIYVPSITITCTFFFILFVLSAIMNSIKLSSISVLQLVHADASAERTIIKGKWTGILSILSIILLGSGYTSMVYMEKLREGGIIIAMFTTTTGTYMLFASVLPLIVKKLKGNKKCNEKGLNAFTFSQLNFRVNSLTKVLATVAMLVALGAGAITGGMAFKNDVKNFAENHQIYDTVIPNPTVEEKEIIKDIPFNEKNEYRFKVDDTFVYYLKEDLEKKRPLVFVYNKTNNKKTTKRVSEELPLGATSIDNENKKVIPETWNRALLLLQSTSLDNMHKTFKIVDQMMYDEIKEKENIVFIGKTDNFTAYTKEWKKIDELLINKYKLKDNDFYSKYMAYTDYYINASGTVFMGFFLGIAFLTMMASCLMFKILTGASKDIIRYEMLRKIGVRRELLSKSIYKELFLVFLFPAIVGIAHVIMGMNIFGFILIDPYFRIWIPIVIFIVIYLMYYLITVQLYKGIVLPKEK
ncbi:FtsX-like permease family protein [Bacillus cereus]|nr:FtsX-like permease family protein [Bacillus cereus]